MQKDTYIFALESSCDETAAAVVKNGREVISNVVATQIEIHRQYGGVVPEVAARKHLESINLVVDEAISQANMKFEDMDAIAATEKPGLVGCLLVGVNAAKTLSLVYNKPFIPVNHLKAHVCANYIDTDLKPPFLCLLVSGGHTQLIKVSDYGQEEIIGETMDDSVGEAYDKVARVLGLGYPGGPLIDKIAKEGNPEAVHFKRVFLEKDSFDFSFSGIKTGVLNYVNTEKQAGREINVADVAASFQQAVLDVTVAKAVGAAELLKKDRLVLAGGVAANSKLRQMLSDECKKKGIKLYYPSPVLCTDNAAMIGCAAYYSYKEGNRDGLDMDAYADLPL